MTCRHSTLPVLATGRGKPFVFSELARLDALLAELANVRGGKPRVS